MEVWSKGLGKKTLNIYLGKGEVKTDGNSIFVEGVIEEPVWWEYRITMNADDLRDVFDIASKQATIDFIVNSPTARGLPLKLATKAMKFLVLYLTGVLRRTLRNRKKRVRPE